MDRKILEVLLDDSISGTAGQDVAGELIDLVDDFKTTDAGPIRERLEVLLSNDYISKRTAGQRRWAEIRITDEGKAALNEPPASGTDADPSDPAASNESGPSEGVELEHLLDRLQDLGAALADVRSDVGELVRSHERELTEVRSELETERAARAALVEAMGQVSAVAESAISGSVQA